MRKHLLLLLFLTTACAPAVYAPVTPIVRVIGPDEAQVIIWDASATAAVVATQAAQATATEVSARATSTTRAQETADSLRVVQTMLAIEQTRIGGAALATDQASIKTQAAAGTHTAVPQTATAAAAEVVATAAYRATQDAREKANQARQDAAAEVLRWGLVISGVIIALGFGLALVFGLSDIIGSLAALRLANAERVRAESEHLRILQYQGTLLQLQEGRWEIMPTAPQLAAPADSPSLDSNVREVPIHGKDHVVVSTVLVGVPETPERKRVLDLLSLAINRKGPNGTHIPSADQLGMHRQEWQTAVDLLKDSPDHPAYVMTTLGRPRAGAEGGTRLCQPGLKTLGALKDAIKRGEVLPLPPPEPISAGAGNVQKAHSETS